MDPFTLALMTGASIAFQGAGLFTSMGASSKINEAQQRQYQLEQQLEAERKKQMELAARRQQLEVVRNAQRMHALSTTVATAQGAQFGSGYAGGQAQITQDAGYNLLGINQNLEIGRNMFGINSQISANKLEMSKYYQDLQLGQGLTSFGQSLFAAAQPAARAATQFRPGQPSFPTYSGPNSYAGWA